MMPLIVVLAFRRTSRVEVPEASIHAPLHVTGLANSVMVNVSPAFVTIGLAMVTAEGAFGAARVNPVAVPPVNPHLMGPEPKELLLLKFRGAAVLRSTPPVNVLLPYKKRLPALSGLPVSWPCQTSGVMESPAMAPVITRFCVFAPSSKNP